jgi:hypothetical protein
MKRFIGTLYGLKENEKQSLIELGFVLEQCLQTLSGVNVYAIRYNEEGK